MGKPKIWHVVALCSVLFVLLGAGSAIGIMYSWWRQTAVNAWRSQANQTQREVQRVLLENLDFVQFATRSISILNPVLPPDPTQLIRMLKAYDDASAYTIGSMGAFRRAPNTTNGKYSWQIAQGFGCPDYIYAYVDSTTPYPAFLGHCTNKTTTAINWTDTAYVGSDYGLKAEEAKIVDGILQYTYLPIFNLLTQFTLTFQTGTGGSGYFAELNLQSFSSYVANNLTGNVYIYETSGGLLVAATGPVVLNGTRVSAATSPTAFIRETYAYALANPSTVDGQTGGWRVNTARYTDTGLDWTIVIVTSDWTVYSDLYTLTGVAVGISVAVAIVCAVISAILTGSITRKEFSYLKGRMDDPEHTELNSERFFDETTNLAKGLEEYRVV